MKGVDGSDIVTVECSNILNSEGFIRGRCFFHSPNECFLLKGEKMKLLKWSHFSRKIFYDCVYMMPKHDWFGDFNKVKEIVQVSEKMSQNGNLV